MSSSETAFTERDLRDAANVARSYYDSTDADEFYWRVWGSADIHVGMYNDPSESIFDASRRTVAHLASLIDDLRPGLRVIDLGSGFCGPARYLAGTHQCQITAVNISSVEIDRSLKLNEEAGLDDSIDVIEAGMEAVPLPDASFDVAWSQDAFLHSGDRLQAFEEVSRLLVPGGQFVMTDPMEADDCPDGVKQPILDRLHLSSLGSPGRYREYAEQAGLEVIEFQDFTPNLAQHYQRVLDETQARRDELRKWISEAYLDRMQVGLEHWVSGGDNGHLSWGCFHFRKQ